MKCFDMGSLLKDTFFVGYSYEASSHKILPRFYSKKGIIIVPFHIGSFVTLVRYEAEWRDKFSVRFISENDFYAMNLLVETYFSNEFIEKQGGKKKVFITILILWVLLLWVIWITRHPLLRVMFRKIA
jgi:hypothetical protein